MFSNGVFKGTVDEYAEWMNYCRSLKPQATLERAMGLISRRERDIGPALGDALQIMVKAHNRIMKERESRRAEA